MGENQRCQVWGLGIFLSSWDFIGIFISKTQSRDFFGIFENVKLEM